MKHFVAVFSLLMIPSCATAASGDAMRESWCFQDRESQAGEWEQLEDFTLIPVAVEAVPRARIALRDTTVLELSPSEAAGFVQSPISSDERTYLIRGALSAAPSADLASILRNAGSARFEAHWSRPTNSLTIVIVQTIQGSVERHNIPFILRTTLPVRFVYVSCWSIS